MELKHDLVASKWSDQSYLGEKNITGCPENPGHVNETVCH